MSGPALAPCDAFVAPLGARAVGGLDDAGRATLEAHLATGCAGCAALASDLDVALDAVRLPEEEPAPGGWERVRLRLEGPGAPPAAEPLAIRVRCTYCRDDLARGAAACCAACLAPHHAECFAEHGRCAAPGCGETRTLEARRRPAGARWATRLLVGGLLLAAGGGVAALQSDRADQASELERLRRRIDLVQSRQQPQLEVVVDEPTYDGQPLSHWLRLLGDRSIELRRNAKNALAIFGPVAVPGLEASLDDSNPVVREEAADVLGRLEGTSRPAIGRLVRLVKDPERDVRVAAVVALGRVVEAVAGQEEAAPELTSAIDALVDALGDESPWVRAVACAGLRRFLPGRCLEPVIAALEDPEASVRQAAAEALLGAPRVTPESLAPVLALLVRERDDARQQELLDLLRRVPATLRTTVRDAVARLLLDATTAPAGRSHAAAWLGRLEPVEERDLLPLARTAGAVEESRRQLEDNQPAPPIRAVLARLGELPPGDRATALRAVARRAFFLGVDPDGALLLPLCAGDQPPELRLVAAEVLLRGPERQAHAGRIAAGVVPELVADLAVAEKQARAMRLAALLGPAAAATSDALAGLAGEGTPDLALRASALETLATVAPTDSRTLTLTVDALRSLHSELVMAGVSAVANEGPAAEPEAILRVGGLLPAQGPIGDRQGRQALRALAAVGERAATTRRNLEAFLRNADVTDEELRAQAIALLERLR